MSGLRVLVAFVVVSTLVVFLSVAFVGAATPADADAGVPASPSKEVTVSIRSTPVNGARVTWGRKTLGRTPLKLKWPRDSGPLDLQLRRTGYLTVNTRAYTFRDEDLLVKLTPKKERHTLPGYRQPLDGGPQPGAVNDGGVGDPGTP